MSWNSWIRNFHRWMAVFFTVVVFGIFVTLGLGRDPAEWVYFMPLLPLALLMFSGLYLFVLPYVTKWQGARRDSA